MNQHTYEKYIPQALWIQCDEDNSCRYHCSSVGIHKELLTLIGDCKRFCTLETNVKKPVQMIKNEKKTFLFSFALLATVHFLQ